jgi:hypothetical protein
MLKIAVSLLGLISLLVGITNCGPNQEPIKVVSVSVVAITPAGPTLGTTLKNVGTQPVIDVSATLELKKDIFFGFKRIVSSQPLLPGESASDNVNLVGPDIGWDPEKSYPLKMKVTLQDGTKFAYTKQVKIDDSPFP